MALRPTTRPRLRAAVVGMGYYGRYHALKYHSLPEVELVGVADADPRARERAAAEYAIPVFADYRELAGRVDAVSIVTPASTHYPIARFFLEQGVHVLEEKPLAVNSTQARELAALAAKRGCVLQPGHLERFNAALQALHLQMDNPCYLESRRLALNSSRGMDVNVVLDLMIHDIDLALTLVPAPVVEVAARGVKVFSGDWDVANARLRFANGSIANITASRASPEPERRLHLFQDRACALSDLLAGHTVIYQLDRQDTDIRTHELRLRTEDPLLHEITAFVRAVRDGIPPPVTAEDGLRALEIAERIIQAIEHDAELPARLDRLHTGSDDAIAFLRGDRRWLN